MKVIKTTLSDVLILEPKLFGDERGFFLNPIISSVISTREFNARSFRTTCRAHAKEFFEGSICKTPLPKANWSA